MDWLYPAPNGLVNHAISRSVICPLCGTLLVEIVVFDDTGDVVPAPGFPDLRQLHEEWHAKVGG